MIHCTWICVQTFKIDNTYLFKNFIFHNILHHIFRHMCLLQTRNYQRFVLYQLILIKKYTVQFCLMKIYNLFLRLFIINMLLSIKEWDDNNNNNNISRVMVEESSFWRVGIIWLSGCECCDLSDHKTLFSVLVASFK